MEDELKSLGQNPIFDKDYKAKKLKLWAIRTVIGVVACFFIYKYSWGPAVIIIYACLALLSLSMILILPKLLKKKYDRVNDLMKESEKHSEE